MFLAITIFATKTAALKIVRTLVVAFALYGFALRSNTFQMPVTILRCFAFVPAGTINWCTRGAAAV